LYESRESSWDVITLADDDTGDSHDCVETLFQILVVVNRELADLLWPGVNPVGRPLTIERPGPPGPPNVQPVRAVVDFGRCDGFQGTESPCIWTPSWGGGLSAASHTWKSRQFHPDVELGQVFTADGYVRTLTADSVSRR
jgi:hypothetical protein